MLPMILVTDSTQKLLNLIEKTRKEAWLGFIEWMNIEHWITIMVIGAMIIQEESQK